MEYTNTDGFADLIAETCYHVYKSKIPNTKKPKDGIEWTLLAAIVMTTSSVLNDSHAEVLTRRGFIRFLQHQVKLAFDGTSDILEQTRDNRFVTKPSLNVKFHLFTSHVPCGDAAIFPKSSQEEEEEEEKERINDETHLASKRARIDRNCEEQSIATDIHRTGAKCVAGGEQDLLGDGLDYHTVGVLRTKPGRGDRTLSMSCSDKIARWNVLGLQGTLLMQFLKDPIYLTTIVLGKCFFLEEALRRAVVQRLDPICDLPQGYRRNIPNLLQSKLRFKHARDDEFGRDQSKLVPTASSIVWCDLPSRNLDVVVDGYKQGTTKTNRGTAKSRCCVSKYELFASFYELLTKQNKSTTTTTNSNSSVSVTKESYEHHKLSSSRNHQIAKGAFLKIFNTWTIKPTVFNQFKLE